MPVIPPKLPVSLCAAYRHFAALAGAAFAISADKPKKAAASDRAIM
jgi:hypothetical protein